MFNTKYNPDVLSCLANLSNDEVFTPPNMVNQMLDTLPQELFESKGTTFLDPVTKSGVFLREIAKRLNTGLENEIPDRQERLNHIFTKQLFGIAITELTALLARRSVYCTKKANSNYSICDDFETEEGNIKFERILHTWKNKKCTFCGASETEYKRGDQLETHAYEFIHTDEPENIYNMRFDVIIGNPPYQLSDGGGRDSGAISLYNKFVTQAKKLNPRFLSMIIPARWYSGGKGLDEFRKEMLTDNKISEIHDFPETADCFPGINIRGGVCYFLWDKKGVELCKVVNYKDGLSNTSYRKLLENDSKIFIRHNDSINILRKVADKKEDTYSSTVSPRKPFGLESNFKDFSPLKDNYNNIYLYRFGDNGYINIKSVIKNQELVNKIKVLVSKASPGGDTYPHKIISEPIISNIGSASTETYLIVDVVESINQAENLISYMKTDFFRFMMSLVKNTQNISRGVFSMVPKQNLDEVWSDEKLYRKYDISDAEIEFISTLIQKMD